MAQQYATAAGVGTGPEMPWMIDLSDIPVKAGPTYPQLFADGGRVTQDDLDRNGWRWASIDELQDDDPLFKTIDPTDDQWIVDGLGRLVPKSTVNNWLNSYERQTLYQSQNDAAADEWIRQRMQHRLNQEFNRQVDNFFMGNWTRPSQLLGAFNPHGDDLGIPFSQRLLLGTGNTGIVSPEFMQKHPYIGEGLNMAFDITMPNAIRGIPEMYSTAAFPVENIIQHGAIAYPHAKGLIARRIPATSINDLKLRYAASKNPSIKSNIEDYIRGGYVDGIPTVPSDFLPDVTKDIIRKDVLGRWQRARQQEHLPEQITALKLDEANNILEDTEWFDVPKAAYDMAGKKNWNGFVDPRNGFYDVSVNNVVGSPELTVLPHEVDHLLDGDFLTGPIRLTPNQKAILNKAWGNEFINATGYGLEDAKTTNLDSRMTLFKYRKRLLNASIEEQNRFIDAASDADIVRAVQHSNGYGRAFIQHLRDSGHLTPERIQLLRESMKALSLAAPTVPAFLSEGSQH